MLVQLLVVRAVRFGLEILLDVLEPLLHVRVEVNMKVLRGRSRPPGLRDLLCQEVLGLLSGIRG